MCALKTTKVSAPYAWEVWGIHKVKLYVFRELCHQIVTLKYECPLTKLELIWTGLKRVFWKVKIAQHTF